MSISERAVATVQPPAEIPKNERPISERYRLAALDWVDKDAAARAYDDLRHTTRERMKQDLIDREGDMPDSHAERRVMATKDWEDYVRAGHAAKTEANKSRVYVDVLKMRFQEWIAADASARAEMKLSR